MLVGGAAAAAPASAAAPAVSATVLVDSAATGPRVPNRFLGFSAESANSCALARLGPAYRQLFRNLGPGTVRVGGNTVEGVRWVPAGTARCTADRTVMTKDLLDEVFALARSVGWTVTWTVPLDRLDVPSAVAQARHAASQGAALESVEFGNEPDLYKGATDVQAMQDWRTLHRAFRASGATAPVSGPGTSAPSVSGYFGRFVAAEHEKLSFATAHRYFGGASTTNPKSVHDLLSPTLMRTARSSLTAGRQAALERGLALEVNETNSFYAGGQEGASDTFAAALWGVDYLFTGLESGVRAMLLHGVPDDPAGNSHGQEHYEPIRPDGTPAPLYYGMLMFQQAAPAGATSVSAAVSSAANVAAHAVRAPDGSLRVVLVNKTTGTDVAATVSLDPRFTSGRVLRLAGPSVRATSGATLGGSPVSSSGTWSPRSVQTVEVTDGSSSISVPAASAVLITYRPEQGLNRP